MHHTVGWQGALPTVGQTAKGQLWHFPSASFFLMEEAEHSWVSSLVLPTSVTHKSLIGHTKSCHLGLLGLLCFLTRHLLPPRLQELRVSFFKTFVCSSQLRQVAVPCSAAISARLCLQIQGNKLGYIHRLDYGVSSATVWSLDYISAPKSVLWNVWVYKKPINIIEIIPSRVYVVSCILH